jgi:CheY-like chemotaxis protein
MNTTSQVLVVDDDVEVRKLVSALLQRIGLQSILVKDGRTALTLVNEGLVPSLIILDLAMPDMDGFDVLMQIRQIKSMDTVPVLLLAAQADPEVIRRGLSGGADAYVTKPYITHSLIDRVRVLVAAGRRPQPKTRMVRRTAPLRDPDQDAPTIESPIQDDSPDARIH